MSEKLIEWADKLKKEFDQALYELRIRESQESTNTSAFQIPDDDNDYDSSIGE